MKPLSQRRCEACTTGSTALLPEQRSNLMAQLTGWQLVETAGVTQLSKTYLFGDFNQALAFSNQVGGISEEQNHHPALLIEWGKVTVNWWSHSVSGLQQNDFIMAARTDVLAQQAQGLKNR